MFLVLLVALCEASFGGGFQVADELVENCKDENGCLELKGDEKTKCEQKSQNQRLWSQLRSPQSIILVERITRFISLVF